MRGRLATGVAFNSSTEIPICKRPVCKHPANIRSHSHQLGLVEYRMQARFPMAPVRVLRQSAAALIERD